MFVFMASFNPVNEAGGVTSSLIDPSIDSAANIIHVSSSFHTHTLMILMCLVAFSHFPPDLSLFYFFVIFLEEGKLI